MKHLPDESSLLGLLAGGTSFYSAYDIKGYNDRLFGY